MVYCTANEIFAMSGVTSSDVTTSQMNAVITSATARLNADINLIIREERALYIDQYRENKIDGSNTVYYVQDSYKYYIGDYDNDGDVDENDVTVWLYDTSTRLKTEAVVSAVDWQYGKITLASAPVSSTNIFITYARAPLDESTPHRLIKDACKALSASLAYMKIRADDYQKLDLGDFAITAYAGGQSKNSPFGLWSQTYEEIIRLINSGELLESAEQIGLNYLDTGGFVLQ